MLIIGCGHLGQKIAERMRQDDLQACCLVSRRTSAQSLAGQGFRARAVDLDSAPPPLSDYWNRQQLFYLVPPPATGTTDPRVSHLIEALLPCAGRRVVYISTSGVYGDCGGDWVDEHRPPKPTVDRAKRRLDAETQWQAWRAAGHGELVILRVAGIYGPGKLPLERLRKGTPMVGADEAPWTNRIHVDDLVSVCLAAMTRGRDGAIYNVSDGNPGNMRDYFDRVADLYRLPRAPEIRLNEAADQLSAGLLSYLRESRRLDNRCMLAELGIELRYPTLAEGLAACRHGGRKPAV